MTFSPEMCICEYQKESDVERLGKIYYSFPFLVLLTCRFNPSSFSLYNNEIMLPTTGNFQPQTR